MYLKNAKNRAEDGFRTNSAARSFRFPYRRGSQRDVKTLYLIRASEKSGLASRLGTARNRRVKPTMTYRIDRVVVGEEYVILRISGRITGQDVDMLRALLGTGWARCGHRSQGH